MMRALSPEWTARIAAIVLCTGGALALYLLARFVTRGAAGIETIFILIVIVNLVIEPTEARIPKALRARRPPDAAS